LDTGDFPVGFRRASGRHEQFLVLINHNHDHIHTVTELPEQCIDSKDR
jgi:hypothetical protein